MQINGGATLWARQTIDSDIFYKKPAVWFKIWFYLVSKANHKDTKQFKRGNLFTKYEWISEATGATLNQIKHCVEYLKHATMIATQKKTRGMLVTVINYDFYQTIGNYHYKQEATQKGKQKPHRSHTKDKYVKNDKNEKKVQVHTRIFLFWNSQKIVQHTKLTPNMKSSINARLEDGHTAELIEEAIHNYSEILQSPKHFPSYKWTLQNFLSREAGAVMEKFQTKNDPFTSYLRFDERGKESYVENLLKKGEVK